MDSRDVELIERNIDSDDVLAGLYKEHMEFERQLEKFNRRPYLTPGEEMERKKIQKLKLLGKDKIEEKLRELRHSATA